jgi:hypothetical protein
MDEQTKAALKKERQAEVADELDMAIDQVFNSFPDIDNQEQGSLVLNIAIKNIMFQTNALVASEVILGTLQSWIGFARNMAEARGEEIEPGYENDYDFVRRTEYEAVLYTKGDEDEELDHRLINLDEYDEPPN